MKKFKELKTRASRLDRIKPGIEKYRKNVQLSEDELTVVSFEIDYPLMVEDARNRYEMAIEEGGDPLEQFTTAQLYENYIHLWKKYGKRV
ncbi:MAG: hypothetical protein JJE29_00440 [Peptostreptococcaceae bacterium]|nr:hypothetical protein [Peptostreptococcaceae bacterium]